MAVETAGATGALLKIAGVPIVTSAAATALGFMFMWPKTRREAYFRMATTIIVSTFVGPLLVIALRSAVPSLFVAARDGALLYGLDPAVGFLLIAAPVMVFAGLPAWWIVGALVRWLDKRKDKDIGELAADAKQTIQQLRGAA